MYDYIYMYDGYQCMIMYVRIIIQYNVTMFRLGMSDIYIWVADKI